MFKDLSPSDRFVAFLSTILVSLFSSIAIASLFLPVRADAEIKQTVIALVLLAAGYYLGSNASSKVKDKVISDMAQTPTPGGPAGTVSTTTTVTDVPAGTETRPAEASALPIAPTSDTIKPV